MKILVLVVTCLAAGYFASLATQSSIDTWYPTLVKPPYNPPNWIFPTVWGILYAIMGVAGGLVWGRIDFDNERVKNGLKFFAIQLILNVLWSFLFFGLKNPLLALVEIIVLWLMIYETWMVFARIDRISGYLFIPYLLWVAFAAVLNANIWWLNK
jgi:benzodiazapine receptor